MPGSPRDLAAHTIKDYVEKETNGTVEIQLYPSGQLAKDNELVPSAQNGNIEMIITPVGFMGVVQPLVGVMDIPFMYPDTNEGMLEFLETDAAKDCMKLMESKNLITLDFWFGGLKNFSANVPLRTLQDFKGVKFRIMPVPIIVEQFKALGASGSNIDFSEVYTALQTGALDGQENSYDIIYEQKFHEVQKYILESEHASLIVAVTVSKIWWDGLPKDIQGIITEAVGIGQDVCNNKTLENVAKYKELIKKSGVEIIEMTKEDKQAFNSVREQVVKLYIDKFGSEGEKIYNALANEAAAIKEKTK